MNTRTIKVDYLARVEGEGALYIKVKNGLVEDVQFKIFEPPRLFEAFMRGRSFREAPDITARICGICPVAYQMSSVHAMEMALGVKVDGQLRQLRRLLYCGEWIESHALHVYMLHAPDFLGYPDALAIARESPELVKKALYLKKVGNELVTLVGGREIHPVNVKVGGFYRVPLREELRDIAEKLKVAREIALETVQVVSSFDFPELEQDYEFVALQHLDEYPFNEGRLVSNKGLNIGVEDYEKYFVEEHIAYSNALHSKIKGGGAYLVGPMARFNLNYDRLSPMAQQAARDVKLVAQCRNPFKSIVVRAVELVYACDEALRIIEQYERPARPCLEVSPSEGSGYGCTEAPRGILYHRYKIDGEGKILEAKIVPPTSQNQKIIESDLWQLVSRNLELPQAELTHKCEQAIRNYDPCISCATHFLDLKITRE
jgi:coenzyme F420-reducing hydrogenase alpha subunit